MLENCIHLIIKLYYFPSCDTGENKSLKSHDNLREAHHEGSEVKEKWRLDESVREDCNVNSVDISCVSGV